MTLFNWMLGALCAGLCCSAQAGDISTFAGGGSGGQYATRVSLVFPTAVAAGANGDVYIADQRSVRRVNANGVIGTLAGGASTGYAGDGGPATAALLNDPRGVAADGVGNVYIADTNNHRVRKVAVNGTIVTVAGNGAPGSTGDGGAATAASLQYPSGVAVDAAGVLYIADTVGNRIRKVGLDGVITTVVGDGGSGISGDGGNATLARVSYPRALVFDRNGNLFIADTGNGRIRKVTPGGLISTAAGGGTDPDSATATSALISTPYGVAVDSAGTLFIVEKDRHRIIKVSVDGALTVLAGNGNYGFAGDGGPAAGAMFNLPQGVAADSYGNVLAADAGNHRVRRIDSDAVGAPPPVGSGAFLQTQRVLLSYTPSMTAIGDVTGDGRDDLITGTLGGAQDPVDDYAIQIHVQQPNGQLAAPVRLRYQTGPQLWKSKLVLADLNKDGVLDIVIAHYWGFSYVPGNRSASFAVKYVRDPDGASGQGMTVAVMDANRDGNPDVIVGNAIVSYSQYRPVSRIYYGDGLGGFPSNAPLETQYQGVHEIEVGDFNGDGIDDLAMITASGSTIEVLLHDPSAGFMRGVTLPGYSRLANLRAGEFDGDGRKELIFSESPAPYPRLRRLRFVSPTTWENAEFIPVPSSGSGEVVVADINADGRDDVIASAAGQLIYSQQTDFGLANPVGYALPGYVSPRADSGPYSLAAGDLNHDGCKDVVASGGGDRGLWLLYGVNCRRAGTVADDVDRDGRSDLLLHSRTQQSLQSRSMLGSRSTGGSFASVPRQYYVVAKGDLTGDGRVDFVWTSDDRLMWLWRSQPDGTYAVELIRSYPPQGWTLVGAGDVDGDGKDDLLWHNPFLQQMDYWLMNGSTILKYGSKEVASRYFPIANGDFNGDGRADIVWTSIDLDVIWMWRGEAGGGFSIHRVASYPPRGWSVVGTGDVNGDGKDDLLWHNRALQRADYWLMDGPQRIGVGTKEVASRYFVVATGDYDGDGRMDVVWTSDDRDDLWLWRGEPGGTFAIEHIGAYPAGDWRLVREPGYLLD